MTFTGGDTHLISSSGRAIGVAAKAVGCAAAPVGRASAHAGAGAGESALTNALDRCGTAWSTLLNDVASQTEAIGKLADVSAADLARASAG